MKQIGFANKYYTLWEYTTDTNTLPNGVRIVKEYHTYIKNISFNRDKAQKLYPGVEIDENLKGISRSFTRTHTVYPNNVFKYGKYAGKTFDEVEDYSYMSWYFTTTSVDQQEELIPILEKQGYHILAYRDGTYGIQSREEYLEQLAHDYQLISVREKITKDFEDGNLIIKLTSNPDYEGEYYDRDSEYTFKFDNVKQYWYDGYPYYLPLLDGKAKRVKNKNIHILDAEVTNNKIFIHSFEIVK